MMVPHGSHRARMDLFTVSMKGEMDNIDTYVFFANGGDMHGFINRTGIPTGGPCTFTNRGNIFV